MQSLFSKFKLALKDRSLRNRILFVVGALAVFRLMATIPIPGVDKIALEQFFASNQFLGLLNIFSGGGLSNLSIVMLGVGPYITASIIMQLLTMMFPKLKEMYHEEGEAGRKKFAQYSRLLMVPLSIIQGFSFIVILQRQGIIVDLPILNLAANIAVIAAGSIMLTWIGELMSEFGIGSGSSLIIFAGIVAGLPQVASQLVFSFSPEQLPLYLGFLAAALAVIAGVVTVTEAERPVPVTYAKRVRGSKVTGGISTYLPLRLNQAGVIPIIFALSILLFPQMIVNFLSNIDNELISSLSTFVSALLANQLFYGSMYFILVVLFTYFYTAVTFDPDSISQNLQKSGAFVPGVRPGYHTATYIGKIVTRITLVGALFLGIIAVLPIGMQALTGLTALSIGGTALLIAVSVVLDLIRKIEAQVSMREY
ncbi:MAG: preprotein translocase subunit SecY [Parcubacteria group bacterium Gr01-1014_48]|nr:MAG: preprotein translocase subunit SecY [Parcubacteria group bacterium Greene0416_14]TSC71419.1 MAG: preprotein translocase subunit SecY [Parcubacteria group bacterium Gr01-1014_48]TSD00579.1 MAG: preprotein translocase subunit SecY [Parcubacteria group bacterium Greene1014_15]TSD08270.1 MAG: preprotein translocase subunit SecY [Parcubacteria group bacterium Greene0714_4]